MSRASRNLTKRTAPAAVILRRDCWPFTPLEAHALPRVAGEALKQAIVGVHERRAFVLEPDDKVSGALGVQPNGAVVQAVSTEALPELSYEIVDEAGLAGGFGHLVLLLFVPVKTDRKTQLWRAIHRATTHDASREAFSSP